MIDTGPDWVSHPCSLHELAETAHFAYRNGGPLQQTQYDPTNTEMTALLSQRHNCQLAASSFPHTNEPLAATLLILGLLVWTLFALVGAMIVTENPNAKVLSRP